jgi:hypothetical protein
MSGKFQAAQNTLRSVKCSHKGKPLNPVIINVEVRFLFVLRQKAGVVSCCQNFLLKETFREKIECISGITERMR